MVVWTNPELAAGSTLSAAILIQLFSSVLQSPPTKMNTEEAFVLASLKEFVKLWGSGCQSSFKLECNNGEPWFHLSSRLASPGTPHFDPHVPHQGDSDVDQKPPQKGRQKGPARRRKDFARSEAHREKLKTS